MHERMAKGVLKINQREEKLVRGIYGKEKEFLKALEKPLKRGNLDAVRSSQALNKS
jgi:hypothetical protein